MTSLFQLPPILSNLKTGRVAMVQNNEPESRQTVWHNDSIYCEAIFMPEDVLYEGSEDEDYENPSTRKQKYEAAGQRYLNGETPFLLSASLRGPFDKESGWVNPWRSKHRTSKPTSPNATSQTTTTHPLEKDQNTLGPVNAGSLDSYLPSPESVKQAAFTEPHPFLQENQLAVVQSWRSNIASPASDKDVLSEDKPSSSPSTRKRKATESSWLKRISCKRRRTEPTGEDFADTIQFEASRPSIPHEKEVKKSDEVPAGDEITANGSILVDSVAERLAQEVEVLDTSSHDVLSNLQPPFLNGMRAHITTPTKRILPRRKLGAAKDQQATQSENELTQNEMAAATLSSPVSQRDGFMVSSQMHPSHGLMGSGADTTKKIPQNGSCTQATSPLSSKAHKIHIVLPEQMEMDEVDAHNENVSSQAGSHKAQNQHQNSAALKSESPTLLQNETVTSMPILSDSPPDKKCCDDQTKSTAAAHALVEAEKAKNNQGEKTILDESMRPGSETAREGPVPPLQSGSSRSRSESTLSCNSAIKTSYTNPATTDALDVLTTEPRSVTYVKNLKTEKGSVTLDLQGMNNSIAGRGNAATSGNNTNPTEQTILNVEYGISHSEGELHHRMNGLPTFSDTDENETPLRHLSGQEVLNSSYPAGPLATSCPHPFDGLLRSPYATSTPATNTGTNINVPLVENIEGPSDKNTADPTLEPVAPARPSTPEAQEPQFSVATFNYFMTPSPERRSRLPMSTSKARLHVPFPGTRGVLVSALRNPRRGSVPKKRVSWAPFTSEKRISGDDEDVVIVSSRDRRHTSSPPPMTSAHEQLTFEDGKFQNHFSAVTTRNTSQGVSSRLNLQAIAEPFSTTDDVEKSVHNDVDDIDSDPMDIVEDMFNEMGDFLQTWDVDEELEEARKAGCSQPLRKGIEAQSPW